MAMHLRMQICARTCLTFSVYTYPECDAEINEGAQLAWLKQAGLSPPAEQFAARSSWPRLLPSRQLVAGPLLRSLPVNPHSEMHLMSHCGQAG